VTNTAVEAAGPEIETFATPAGRYLGYIVVGAAVVLCLLGLKSQGTGSFGLMGFCLAFSALAWVALIRPRVTAHQNGLLLRNMLRDTFLPWASIKSCRAAQTLQIGTRDKIYHGLGLTKSARQASREQRQRRSGGRTIVGPNLGMSSMASAPTLPANPDDGLIVNKVKEEQIGGSYFSHAEQRIEILAKQGASKTAGTDPKVVWDPVAIAGLLLAGLGVVFAFFN
jgi:PH (Pleckstrin Homology) domain-containing protein